MDLFSTFKVNFKNLFFNSYKISYLITERSFEIFYLSCCLLQQWWRFRSSGDVSQYILRSESIWHPLSKTMPENKQNVSLEISRLMAAFSLWPYNLVLPTIISTNTPTKNDSESLRGAPASSGLLNCGLFACSTTLLLRFSHFISKRSGFG